MRKCGSAFAPAFAKAMAGKKAMADKVRNVSREGRKGAPMGNLPRRRGDAERGKMRGFKVAAAGEMA